MNTVRVPACSKYCIVIGAAPAGGENNHDQIFVKLREGCQEFSCPACTIAISTTKGKETSQLSSDPYLAMVKGTHFSNENHVLYLTPTSGTGPNLLMQCGFVKKLATHSSGRSKKKQLTLTQVELEIVRTQGDGVGVFTVGDLKSVVGAVQLTNTDGT